MSNHAMKIAVMADFHGNYHGLEAILADLDLECPDVVVCAGDLLGSLPGSLRVWQKLTDLGIPIVRGNQEEYLLAYHKPEPNGLVKDSVQFMPIQYIARQLPTEVVNALGKLPLGIYVEGPGGDDVFVCHASPNDLFRSYALEIDAKMAEEICKVEAATIVAGHLHRPWQQVWQGKQLVMTGSGGLPLRGKTGHVEYLILTHLDGAWEITHKEIPYDFEGAVDAIVQSDYLEKTGPIGWLMFDEVLMGQSRVFPFLRDHCPEEKPSSMAGWQDLAIGFLEEIGRWDTVKAYL